MRRFLTALVGALATLACGPSAAEVYTWTFRGVVGVGEDQTGVFGAPGSNPAGMRWMAVVTTDTATPDADITFGDNYSQIVGSLASPVVVTFTMGDVTRVFGIGNPDPYASHYGGQAQLEGPIEIYGFQADEYFAVKARNGTGYYAPEVSYYRDDWIELGGVGLGQDFLPGPDFRTLPSLTTADGAVLFGYVSLSSEGRDRINDLPLHYESAWASLLVRSVTAGAVPEPQAWALMIAGFGAVGAALRRRYRLGRYATSTLPAC